MERGPRSLRHACAVATLAVTAPAAALALTAPAPAGAKTLAVHGQGATAIVTLDPFRLEIRRAGGRSSGLGEVANTRPRPTAMPPTADPIAPGTDAQVSHQLYAPLSYLVGTETIEQYAGGVWAGNLKSGVRQGTQYAARRVISARRRRGALTLTVATNDPSKRTLTVTVAPAGRGLIHVSATPHPALGVTMMSDAFTSTRSEAFHGFGGPHNAIDQHGVALSTFDNEENIAGLPTTTGPSSILFPNGPTGVFYSQAQFISSHGYGFLLDQPQLARFRLDSDKPNAWSVAVSAPSLSYVVAPGTPTTALANLTARTGRQPAPPAWGLGPMLDRLVKNGGTTLAQYEASLKDDLANIDRYHLPLTAYRIEGWNMRNDDNDGLVIYNPRVTSFATQQKLIGELHARHIHVIAYLRPFITPGSLPDRQHLTVRHAEGSTYTTTGTLGQHIALLDFSNPAAVAYWKRELAKIFDYGFDGFHADFGEEVMFDMHFANGETGRTMHNRYTVLYQKANRAAIVAYERGHPHRQLWFFNRTGYSGSPGSAAYEYANIPGDEATNWAQAAGLRSLAPDMLNRAVGGAYGFATDIGGYYDYTSPATTKELLLRWAEWAALSPVFRLHGSGRAGTHTPWSYDGQTVQIYKAISRLHERAAPLILKLWTRADRTGIPPTRPLWLQFPGDRRAAAQQQEWMLGSDVLVAPVVTEGATARAVYFPAGCWRDPQTGRTYHGRRSATISAPLARLPYFFRCGRRPF
jgi:alpha-glucosidase